MVVAADSGITAINETITKKDRSMNGLFLSGIKNLSVIKNISKSKLHEVGRENTHVIPEGACDDLTPISCEPKGRPCSASGSKGKIYSVESG